MTTREPPGTTDDVRTDEWTPRRTAILAGPAMAIAFVGGTILASVMGPSVQWTEHGLNELGAIVQGSVVIGSLLGMVFLWPVWKDAGHIIQRGGIGLFGIALLMMAGVNAAEIVFAELPVAAEFLGLGFLFVLPLAWLVHGLGDVAAGLRQRGVVSLGIWIGYFSVWVYSFQIRSVTVLIGFVWFVLVSAWALVQYVSLRE